MYGKGGMQARRAKHVGRQVKSSSQEKANAGRHDMQGGQDWAKESYRRVRTAGTQIGRADKPRQGHRKAGREREWKHTGFQFEFEI